MQHCQACGGLGTQRAGGAAGRGCRGQGTQGRSTAAGAQGGTLAVGCASGGDSVCEEPGRRCGRQAVPPRLLAWPQGGGQRGGGGPCPSSAPALRLPPQPHPSRAPPRGPSLPRPRAPAAAVPPMRAAPAPAPARWHLSSGPGARGATLPAPIFPAFWALVSARGGRRLTVPRTRRLPGPSQPHARGRPLLPGAPGALLSPRVQVPPPRRAGGDEASLPAAPRSAEGSGAQVRAPVPALHKWPGATCAH